MQFLSTRQAPARLRFMTKSPWRAAGPLFAIGGTLSAVGAVIFAGSSPAAGSMTTLAGLLLEGIAFILFGRGLRGTGLPTLARWLFLIAGSIDILFTLLAALWVNIESTAIVLLVVNTLLIVVASLTLVSYHAVARPLGWAFVVLAVCLAINMLSGSPATLVLVGAVYVTIGVLLITGSRSRK